MKTREVMTTNVCTVAASTAVAEAMRLMLERSISGLPVLDADGSLVGIVTEGDFMRRGELGTERRRAGWLQFVLGPGRIAGDYTRSHAQRVEQVMTRSVVGVDADAPLADAVQLLEKHHFKRLPVLEGERLVGVLSRADLMRAFLATRAAQSAQELSDAAIARCIETELDKQPWCPRQNVRIEVHDGSVQIDGVVSDERMREALRVVVENTPGVRNAIDHLLTVEPVSGLIVKSPPP